MTTVESHAATEFRKAVLDALRSPVALTEEQARELIDRLEREYRQAGYSSGYDEGHHDGTWD